MLTLSCDSCQNSFEGNHHNPPHKPQFHNLKRKILIHVGITLPWRAVKRTWLTMDALTLYTNPTLIRTQRTKRQSLTITARGEPAISHKRTS